MAAGVWLQKTILINSHVKASNFIAKKKKRFAALVFISIANFLLPHNNCMDREIHPLEFYHNLGGGSAATHSELMSWMLHPSTQSMLYYIANYPVVSFSSILYLMGRTVGREDAMSWQHPAVVDHVRDTWEQSECHHLQHWTTPRLQSRDFFYSSYVCAY